MKKKIVKIAGAGAAFVTFLSMTGCSMMGSSTDTASGGEGGGFNWSWIIMIGIYAAVILGAYFLLFRPQSKKKKAEAALRRNAQIGDEVTTIGGITGKIVAIREDTDTLVLETGSDRHKINIKRWGISSVDTLANGEPNTPKQPEKTGLFGGKKKDEKNDTDKK